MSDTFKMVRFEPRMLSSNPDCVCEIILGVTLTSEDSEHSAYIDGVWKPEEGTMLMLSDLTPEKSSEIISQFGSDCGWWESLRNQIEASKLQPVNPESFTVPEITLDTSLEPTPEPEPEPIPVPEPVVEEDTTEAEGDTDGNEEETE